MKDKESHVDMALDSNGNSDYSGLSKKEVLALRLKYVGSPTAYYFRDDPMMIVQGEGQYLIDEKGNRFLDCINNVAHVGHTHPEITRACALQMTQLYTNSRYLHEANSILAERLTSKFPHPLNVCFFTNSGSESNDLALTLAATYTGGTDVITLDGAYHGHLQSCMAISPYKWKSENDKPEHVHVASSPCTYRGKYATCENPAKEYVKELEDTIASLTRRKRKLSAFIMESMQSCGGQIIPPEGYMRDAFGKVHAAGGVCIADEVQVGFGRVGTHFWAFQLQGPDVIPDIVTIGKPMGNGHPVAAVVTTKEIADTLFKKTSGYFNTYGGNAVSCTAALAVLDIIENEDLMENAIKVGRYLLEKLEILKKKHAIVGDIRGRGMFAGIELVSNRQTKEPATEEASIIYDRMKERCILISLDGPDNNVIKFKPPMCFSMDNVDQLVATLDDVMVEVPVSGHANY